MNLGEYIKKSKIPSSVLKKIAYAGLLEDPLSESDIQGLNFFEKVYTSDSVLRVMVHSYLIRKSKKDRETYLNTIDMETKWERYAYTRFLRYVVSEHGGRKLHMSLVIEEIKKYLNFEPNQSQIKRLYAVRKKAYRFRGKARPGAQQAEIT